jgi:hypothetical protein
MSTHLVGIQDAHVLRPGRRVMREEAAHYYDDTWQPE